MRLNIFQISLRSKKYVNSDTEDSHEYFVIVGQLRSRHGTNPRRYVILFVLNYIRRYKYVFKISIAPHSILKPKEANLIKVTTNCRAAVRLINCSLGKP